MKNKTVLITIISLVVILLLGFVAYSYMQKPQQGEQKLPADNNQQKKTENTIVTNEEIAKQDTQDINGSLLDLINMGKSLMCTFEYNEEQIRTSGTTFVSGKQMRGEFTTMMDGKEVKSNIISDGNYFYSWSDAMPNTGMKMKIDNLNTDTTNQNNNESLKDLNGKYNYKCGNWKSDVNKFAIPTNITFTDFSQVMQNAKETTPNLCATCDVITDQTAKAQCKTQFKCE